MDDRRTRIPTTTHVSTSTSIRSRSPRSTASRRHEQWRDTVIVERKGGTLTSLTLPRLSPGLYVHCHMMNHEEMGMMASVEVYEG